MSLKIENSRRVAKSRPVCVGLYAAHFQLCRALSVMPRTFSYAATYGAS
jgi:hypothetical protein